MKNIKFREGLLIVLITTFIYFIISYYNLLRTPFAGTKLVNEFQKVDIDYALFFYGETGEKILNEFKSKESGSGLYALLATGMRRGRSAIIIHVYSDKAILRYIEPFSGVREKYVPLSELDDFKEFLKTEKVDELKHFNANVRDGTVYLYLHITEKNRYQVFMNNPRTAEPDSIYNVLVRNFMNLIPIDHI